MQFYEHKYDANLLFVFAEKFLMKATTNVQLIYRYLQISV